MKLVPNQNPLQNYLLALKTIKEEPIQIGIVNVPKSSPSIPEEPVAKNSKKRSNSTQFGSGNTKAGRNQKRKKSTLPEAPAEASRKSIRSQQKFTCDECFNAWGEEIQINFSGDPTKKCAPDPKQNIPTFSSFEDYKEHHYTTHKWLRNSNTNYCKEKGCLLWENHDDTWPHGDIKCKICNLSFEFMKDHDYHMLCEHADINLMQSKAVYNVFLKMLELPT